MPLSELIADLRNESELWSALSTEDEDEASAVRSVFAWSYRALPSDAARLFCFLGLHPGKEFSQAAAAALADNARHVRSSLDVLVGACMLENSGFNRYQFHDLLRAYAVDLARYEVPQEEQLGAVERICTWYLHTAYQCALALAHDTTLLFPIEPAPGIEPLSFTDRAAAARWYEEEKTNLVGAVRAARETRLLSLSWRLADVPERIYATYNHVQDWRTTSLLGLQAAQDLGLRENEAVMCESLGRLCRMTLQLDEAAEYHRRAVAIHREHGDPLSVVKRSTVSAGSICSLTAWTRPGLPWTTHCPLCEALTMSTGRRPFSTASATFTCSWNSLRTRRPTSPKRWRPSARSTTRFTCRWSSPPSACCIAVAANRSKR